MSIEIRTMKKSDIRELSEMWYELASWHENIMEGYELSDSPKKGWREFMKKGLSKENMITFVAEDGNEIVGFVSVVLRRRPPFFKQRDVGLILDLFVKEKRRREGIGSKLIEHTEDWIKDNGVSLAVLTVAPVNHIAVDFWEKNGYDTYLEKKRKEL